MEAGAQMRVTKVERIHYDTPIPVYDAINAVPNHNFIVCGDTVDLVSHNCGFMDEIKFARSGIKDINKCSIILLVEFLLRTKGPTIYPPLLYFWLLLLFLARIT